LTPPTSPATLSAIRRVALCGNGVRGSRVRQRRRPVESPPTREAMITIIVNGEPREVTADPTARLVEVLREDLGLRGTRFGCGHGECGACTVIVAGQAVRSCQVPIRAVAGREIVTIEGVGSSERPHPLQVAVGKAQAFQCGHCASGMIMEAKALWDSTPRPTEAQVRKAMEGHQCMCGSHGQVVRALLHIMAPGERG